MTVARPRPPVDCPVCGFALEVTRLACQACGTELTGRFTPCPLCALSDGEVELVQAILVAGGDVDEAARRTDLGSDVVQEQLRAAAAHLGLPPTGPHPAASDRVPADLGHGPDDDFLQQLARGVVEADDALRRLP